jgi:hypothetical protein
LASKELIEAILDLEHALDISHEYESYDFIYYVSEDRNDHWIRYLKIVPPASSMIAIKTLKFGAIGQGTQQSPRFEDLHIRATSSVGRAYVFPSGERDGQLQGTVIMSVPIKPGDPIRDLHLTGRSPSMWAPLRATGKDKGVVEMIHAARKLTISVVLPIGITPSDANLTPLTKLGKNSNVEKKLNIAGHLQFDWTITDAKVDKYEFAVECNRLIKPIPQENKNPAR